MKLKINLAWLAIAAAILAAGCSPKPLPSESTPSTPVESRGSESAGDAVAKETVEAVFEHADAGKAKQLLASDIDVIVLDVRTPSEFEAGHIPGAKNIDFRADNFAEEIAALDKSTSYMVHCASGGRSTRSLELFKEQGFQHVIHLDGGLNGWKSAGNPVTAD